MTFDGCKHPHNQTQYEIKNVSITLKSLLVPPQGEKKRLSEFYHWDLVLPILELHTNRIYSMYSFVPGFPHSA